MSLRRIPLALAVSSALTGSATWAQESIELRDLDGSNGFMAKGGDSFILSGLSVSGAGDVNGDGIDDIIIGASFANPDNKFYAGQSYVLFGRNAPLSGSVELSNLDGTNGFVLNGIDPYDYSGRSVSGAGDVNGDGLDDVIVGAYRADLGGKSFAGESYVVFGSDTGFPAGIDLDSLDGSNGFVLNGIEAFDTSGRSVSDSGDVNGDGIDDLIIGAENADPGENSSAGESYVVFGRSIGFSSTIDLENLDGLNGFVLNGIGIGDRSGRAVSDAGDVNGDGIADLLIGAYAADPGDNSSAGESYVVFGRDTGFSASVDLADLNGTNGFVMTGIDAGDRSGLAVSSAGDLNDDGFDDLIIGADLAGPDSRPLAGEGYVVFGRATGFSASIDLGSLNGSNGFTLIGADSNDRAGHSVSGAGDVNGDGIADLIIGASRGAPDGNGFAGESYVVFGRRTAFPPSISLGDLNGADGFVINGVDPGDASGVSVGGAGDVNGDGIDDLIIGASGADPNGISGAGETYVVFGNAAPASLGDTAFLFDELEDDTSASGSRLDFSVAASYLDVDPFGGLAIVDVHSVASEGQWQYSLDGVSWLNLSSNTSDTSAQVLSSESFLRFVPAANFTGQPGPLSVRLWDGRWRQPGSNVNIINAVGALGGFSTDDHLLDVTVNITPVNDAPSFAASNPPTVNEDPDGVTVGSWSAFNPGPGEGQQFALAYQVASVSNPGLFSILPTIDTLGNLVYDTRQDVSGTSTFDVRVVDSGGMANGGVNFSGFQTFTITVNPVNDPPNLIAENPPASSENDGPQTVSNWARVDVGALDEAGQEVSVSVSEVSNPALFTVPPAVDANGTLTYTAAPQNTGTSRFTVIASDNGGTANGGENASQPQQFEITVLGEVVFTDGFE
ncbi:MAG: Ig-like domain-containing protein [Pseudomonadota bacterium]